MNDSTPHSAICVRCGTEYPFTREFFVVSKGVPIRRCRVCDRARVTAHREKHIERYREQDRARWREKSVSDPEWVATRYERTRRWCDAHREYVTEKNREWREKNQEQHRENARQWAARNRERCAENGRQWRARNPELQRAHAKAGRARRREYAAGELSASAIRQQYERQHGRCYWCKKPVGETYHIDHVVPLSLGGGNTPENIVVACPVCNLSKGAKHPMDFGGRLL